MHQTSPQAGARTRFLSRAFTLIELIVVVIIIGVLAAVAAVAYNQFVGNARTTAIHASAKQVDTALTARSAQDERTPSELVVAAIASGNPGAYLGVSSDGATYAADSATAPKVLQIKVGTRGVCLNLGSEPGQTSRISDGLCSTSKTVADAADIGAPAAPPPAAAPAVADDFNRPDGSLGATSTGAKPWTTVTGAWIVSGNTATAAAAMSNAITVVDTGLADGTESVKLQGIGSGTGKVTGLIFRYVDASNYWIAQAGAGGINIQKRVNGTPTDVATDSVPVVAGDTLSLDMHGSTIVVKRSGTTVLNVTDGDHAGATKHGLWSYASTSGNQFDNWSMNP